MANEATKYRYRVDVNDRIVWVDELWLAFARENGATDLTEQRVLNRPLWDFVAGKRVQGLFERIHDRVRSTSSSAILPFRCDSPTLQRHMRMTIAPDDGGSLLYEATLVRTLPQRELRVLDPTLPRSESLLTICSLCKRVLLEPTGWLDVEDAAARLGLFERSDVPQVRNCVCDECARAMSSTPGNGNAA